MNKFLVAIGGFFAFMLVLGLILVAVVVGSYNGIVSADESATAQWGQVENVYQRRFDLIPNLVETVKGYAAHEKGVLEEVTKARSSVGEINLAGIATSPELQQQFLEAQKTLTGALSKLLMIREAYPDLKANQSFLKLQDEIAGTENRVTVERMKFQERVNDYNSRIRRFPGNIVASLGGFDKRDYYKAEEGSQKPPQVKF